MEKDADFQTQHFSVCVCVCVCVCVKTHIDQPDIIHAGVFKSVENGRKVQ